MPSLPLDNPVYGSNLHLKKDYEWKILLQSACFSGSVHNWYIYMYFKIIMRHMSEGWLYNGILKRLITKEVKKNSQQIVLMLLEMTMPDFSVLSGPLLWTKTLNCIKQKHPKCQSVTSNVRMRHESKYTTCMSRY